MATSLPISPLAPAEGFPDLQPVPGVRFAATSAGVKYSDRDDVMLALIEGDAVIAGTFTKSMPRSAAVLDCEDKLSRADSEGPIAILVNSGNANAFTGANGQASVERLCASVSKATGVQTDRIFTASTGVIGEVLPDERIVSKMSDLVDGLSPKNTKAAARATMTTDTFPKGAQTKATLSNGDAVIVGFAKGSGMIAPDMATMLVHIFTDAKIAQSDLQNIVSAACDRTFNAITVDSDMSTSDTLLVVASGTGPRVHPTDSAAFGDALEKVMLDLAHLVVRDGEGASKFIEVEVTGATSDRSARLVALSIANSPLVKTAFAGEDPNWGRIVMAIGKAGQPADRDRLSIWFGDILVAENGWASPSYQEGHGAAYMKNSDLKVRADLGMGTSSATVWTCDFTHQYVSINADYRS